jgi:putative hydrolases of HD superfamily
VATLFGMEIRWLGAGDEDLYREMRLRALADAPQAFASTLEREQAFTPDVWTSRLTNDQSGNLLAVVDGTPLGMATGLLEDPATVHVLGMWVAPEGRGRGVGRRLIETIADWAREHQARHIVLWVTETNEPARALYAKTGFVPTGDRQPLPSDESLMEMKLTREVGERSLLADRTPFPDDLDERLRRQFTFLVEIDRLKAVMRQSPLAAADRRENDAEHSWHLAMMVTLLAEYSDEPIDVGHTIQLVLVHDLVEIYAGDTPLYEAGPDQREREVAAAGELFPLLPEDQAVRIRALWDEFEERRTPEARFAKAMDRLQPLLLNWMARGGTWQTPGVTADDIRARKAVIGDASAALWKAGRHLIDEGESRGWSRRR